MGNCCRSPAAVAREDVRSSGHEHNNVKKAPITVLSDVSKDNIEDKYMVDRELGRGEFGVTYLCIDRSSRELLACKSISKRKLRTAVDVEDVRREVAIMKHLPESSSIVTLREACEDENAVHLVMELCEGGELFDRIVARGHYTERAAAAVARTMVEVVQLCHKHGVIHRDLKPENFLFANKKENSPLKLLILACLSSLSQARSFLKLLEALITWPQKCLSVVMDQKLIYGVQELFFTFYYVVFLHFGQVCNAESEQGVAQAILRGLIDFKREPWPSVSEGAKSLVRQMLEPDPKLRLTAKQVLGILLVKLNCIIFKVILVNSTHVKRDNMTAKEPGHAIVYIKDFVYSIMLLNVIADFLSNDEVEDIKEMFKKIDMDEDGIITIEELKSGLQKLNTQLAESEVQLLIESVDTNGKGTLDYGEFVAISLHLKKMANDEHLHKAFSYFDKDSNGFIEPHELQKSLMEDGDEDVSNIANDIFQEVDTDKDGKISYEEFAAMMKQELIGERRLDIIREDISIT
ncbi:hypothetical protein R6Q59_036329 [Mikania micrantha]